jgi:hypothetical protein
MSGEVNVVALVRGEEQYIFVFEPSRRTELLRLLGRYAADPKLSFNWFDAAVLSQKIREMMPATISSPGAHMQGMHALSRDSDSRLIESSPQTPAIKRDPVPRFQIPGS